MAFDKDHPSYGDLRPLYEVDAARVITASVKFMVDEDYSYSEDIEVPAAELTYSFEIDGRRSEGYVAFISIRIRSIKPSAPITFTVGKRTNNVAAFNRLSINDRHGSPLPIDPNIPDMPVSLHCHSSNKTHSDLCRSYSIHHIVLVTGEDTGLFSVHMTSNQHISSVMMEAKMILVKDKGVDRGIYYRMVTQYDRDILGDVLYHDKREASACAASPPS
jgi:hypothetical protein